MKKVIKKNMWPYKNSEGSWRIETIGELNKLFRNKNIINIIKSNRLRWFGHLHRIQSDRFI